MDDIGDQSTTQLQKQKESTKTGSFFFWLLVFLASLGVDQLSKFIAFGHKQEFRNFAFAFSLPVPVFLIYVIYAVVLGLMFYYVVRQYKTFSVSQKLAWVLIFAGASSNILERIFLGYVRDWIYLYNGVFNLADGYIILGIVILLFGHKKSSDLRNLDS